MITAGEYNLDDWTELERFQPVPADWHVVIADVKGSTRAIEAGRYKDVNALGSSCIIAVANACPDQQFPFVFGGDGASFVVPPQHLDAVMRSLNALRSRARAGFDLDLRLGSVPVWRLKTEGHPVLHWPQTMEGGFTLHLFAGGGLQHAEMLVKRSDSDEPILPVRKGELNLDGLECRWNDVPSTRGRMLTMIVRPQASNIAGLLPLMRLVQQLQSKARPVRTDNLQVSYPALHLKTEVLLRKGAGFAAAVTLRLVNLLLRVFKGVLDRQKNDPGTNAGRYFASIGLNTDHFKLDDVFRAVLDVSDEESQAIESLLQDMRRQGLAHYGLHYSDTALMTCFVKSMRQHVHFVDGSNGGYALAARALKKQLVDDAVMTLPIPTRVVLDTPVR